LAPTSQEQLEWPKWGQHYETKGRAGETPDLPAATRLVGLYEDWLGSASAPAQKEIWRRMLHIWAEAVFSIGTVGGVLQPVVVADKLRNVPKEGIYNWDPGAYFGIYKPDQFWFEEPVTPERSASAGAARPAPR